MIELLKLCAEYSIEFNICYDPFIGAFVIKIRSPKNNMAAYKYFSTYEIESVPSDLIIRRIIDQVREILID